MKNTKIFGAILIAISLFLSGCLINRNRSACPPKRPLFKKYQPRLQGNEKWNYKKYQGPKRKLLK